MKEIVARDQEEEDTPECITKLVNTRILKCEGLLQHLQENLRHLSSELVPIQQKLVSIKRQMAGIASKKMFKPDELKPFLEELRNLEAQKVQGVFLAPNDTVPEGQEILHGLLHECFTFAEELRAREGNVDPALRDTYNKLAELKGKLEKLTLTHRWTLRETDLYKYQSDLTTIDHMRNASGKFLGPQGEVPAGQTVLLYMLRRSYALIYGLLSSSVPVSEALMPIHNQLSTVRRCLSEVKKGGGPYSARELYPYQLKLASIDNRTCLSVIFKSIMLIYDKSALVESSSQMTDQSQKGRPW